ncbi:MAG: [protein-PII] uridylyltransferase [Verrucomicrobiales bacterium]|nr:[protein-PII] uridylyltransferase [Verrucomicrobiales bacterium]
MPFSEFRERVIAHAEEALFPLRQKTDDRLELLKIYRRFLKQENQRIEKAHKSGEGGLAVAAQRSAVLDVVINDLFSQTQLETGDENQMTLVASGGYGRGMLNPGSDIDLQFLMPVSTRSVPKEASETIEQLLLMLYDVGFKVGHGVRSTKEAIKFANNDHQTKTALLDARFIAGDASLFDDFEDKFFKGCIQGKEKDYLALRSRDIRARHKKYDRTVHLQEPNVKEGCGGIRDYHNLIWVLWVLRRSRDLEALVKEELLTPMAFEQIEEAYEFLMRVRNGLHYAQKNRSGDLLTLRLQGVVAKAFGYPGKTMVRRSEEFMRDYYRHTRNLYQHSTSLMQSFELEVDRDATGPVPIIGFLARRQKKAEKFDGFLAREGLIFPESDEIFKEDPKRMMRFFRHTQQRHLTLSPEIRKLFKAHWPDINGNFRKSKSNRETFDEILQHRGDVARTLRQMHRVGFLGRWLPEFGQLTDLVQHEFFHRYTADEHTLRCIDKLDSLVNSNDPKDQFFKMLFQDIEDPVGLYLALIMHDTGRAENVRKHEDGSAMLASEVCTRLRYRGDRRRLITFLVDHHLTFWRTATTKNLGDPATIAEFAAAVHNRSWMEALYLFTYVDSKGTNEEAWNDWKGSLMHELFRSTCRFFENRKEFDKKFNRPVNETRDKVAAKLPESYREEIEAHFRMMPERYLKYRGSTSITRHVKLFHRFLKIVKRDSADCLVPVAGWENREDEGYTLLEVAGWNRHHLLAKVAGALAARNLNILSADLFAREDDLVLDIFRICTTDFRPVRSKREIERIEKLFEQEFGHTEKNIDFHELIEKNQKPSIYRDVEDDIQIPQRVFVSNELNPDMTVLEIQARDRIGLLYDLFTVLGDQNAEVEHARISTQAGAAIDRLYLVDSKTEQKIAEDQLERIEREVAGILKIE